MAPRFLLGLKTALDVREEIIGQHSKPCRIAYVSDIHLRKGRSGWIASQVIDALERSSCDLILLGGDLVDQASELHELSLLVARAREIAPVMAVPGNHDQSVGEKLVRSAVEHSLGLWIDGVTARFNHLGRLFSISGPGALPDPLADVSILCSHYPKIGKSAWSAGFDLVLAGHLHGCQCVLFEAGGLLFPGAIFYPNNRIRHQQGKIRLLISRGCSDLIPIRWNCPREIVLCVI